MNSIWYFMHGRHTFPVSQDYLAFILFYFSIEKAVLNITKCDLCFPFLSAFQVTKIIGKTSRCCVPIWGFANTIHPCNDVVFCSNALDLSHNNCVNNSVIMVSQKPKQTNFLTAKLFNIFH